MTIVRRRIFRDPQIPPVKTYVRSAFFSAADILVRKIPSLKAAAFLKYDDCEFLWCTFRAVREAGGLCHAKLEELDDTHIRERYGVS